MRKLFMPIFSLLFILSCKNQKPLTEQLKDSFAHHLKKIDSSASLDSVHILWNAPITDKLVRIIDDSSYIREFMRVQSQLSSAKQKNDKDSIEFYQYEINFMEKEIDSGTKSIGRADTTRTFGHLIGVAYYISKNQKTKKDSTIIAIDSLSTMLPAEYLDSAMKRTVESLN
ncbi:MAG TPA: hypothetical protein VK543_18785 [Puia sp.]|nr:hypothetical protein [Puia sp.]